MVRDFHLLVRRILKRDESLKLPLASERETERRDENQWEVSTHGIPDWKKLAESIYNANPDRILVTDEIGYGIVPIDAFEREYIPNPDIQAFADASIDPHVGIPLFHYDDPRHSVFLDSRISVFRTVCRLFAR